MPDVTHRLDFAGRATYRLSLRRDHLPAAMQKLLSKLEEATDKRTAAEQATATCGFGTGPELAKFQQAAKKTEAAQLEAYDDFAGAAARNRSALLASTADAYNGALDRAARAERELLDALDEAAEAAALHACAAAGATLDVDSRIGRNHLARMAVGNAAATIRGINLPALDEERAA
ncbi:hypothetical protein OG252_33180 [Streptomyces sp. NBC_01352]|uniref:hypothetical protein n=1 Tax=Streptomyces sp. NBC_01352 TaxID=2903834 RepID=UPI002E304D5B|nr:hypothetical protein [Streptomyces sp. NBC_01352]